MLYYMLVKHAAQCLPHSKYLLVVLLLVVVLVLLLLVFLLSKLSTEAII